ncbi:hypothetical protein Lal_00017115 [Lupinus albus]|uniref:Putative mitochondrial glycoprotein n=1 Tax=Lupinus albus TaxID=3870 RepID=A0A6A5MDI2_LUPAL|nr:putative mitochondrial glycoprotein [Lupinus albus]KAF1869540.1 hypothetical protein Lal_00017115 [Lupinus albus]
MAGIVIRSGSQFLKSNYSSSSFLTILKNRTTTSYATHQITKSPFDSNILRILRNEIDYYSEYLPPPQPIKFKSFRVEERPSEQVITIKGKFGEREDIKIDATMYDGYQHVPVIEDDISKLTLRLHLSVVVNISKPECANHLQFVCSAWPDSLDVHKLYILRHPHMPSTPYLGPNFRNLNAKIQETFRAYLDARGVNNELSAFLHEYVMNKDKIELLRWMDSLKYFMEK